MAESRADKDTSKTEPVETIKEVDPKKTNLFRRSFSILGHLFHRASKEDFEKKLQNLSKEEASVHTRMKRRAQTWRKLARGVIVYSVIVELLILGVAVISTRAPELSWTMRGLRVLPVFAFPAFATMLYSVLARYYTMRERKDQKTLDRLRNERQAKIDELKERTNYYVTQQLIQKYDSDPTAKEAAARVLAAKLGSDAGLKLSTESSQADEINAALVDAVTEATGQGAASSSLRRRTSQGKTSTNINQEPSTAASSQTGRYDSQQLRMEDDQFPGKDGGGGGGLVARLAAMLVGEDPNQCYALICKNCHAHNGLSRQEDFQFVTYYCPHCNFLNGPQRSTEIEDENVSQGSIGTDGGSKLKENGLVLPKSLGKGVKTDSGIDAEGAKKIN